MNKSKYTKCNKPCDFQPSKEEEKHKLCSDYQKACNQCYQEFKDWQKSDESKSQSWEEEIIKAITNIHPWGYSDSRKKAYEEIKSLLTSAIEEERKRQDEKIKAILRKWEDEEIKADGAFFFYELRKILNPNSNKQNE